MSGTRRCPALFIAAPASGQGKTTDTEMRAIKHAFTAGVSAQKGIEL